MALNVGSHLKSFSAMVDHFWGEMTFPYSHPFLRSAINNYKNNPNSNWIAYIPSLIQSGTFVWFLCVKWIYEKMHGFCRTIICLLQKISQLSNKQLLWRWDTSSYKLKKYFLFVKASWKLNCFVDSLTGGRASFFKTNVVVKINGRNFAITSGHKNLGDFDFHGEHRK